MKNSSKIALHLFMIQCFWSLQSHDKKNLSMRKTMYCQTLIKKQSPLLLKDAKQ